VKYQCVGQQFRNLDSVKLLRLYPTKLARIGLRNPNGLVFHKKIISCRCYYYHHSATTATTTSSSAAAAALNSATNTTFNTSNIITTTTTGTAIAQWLGAVLQIGRSLVRSRLMSLEFFIDIKSFRSHYGPEVDSACNRNEYQEYFLGVKVVGA